MLFRSIWCYIPNHTKDDGWNGEDFSIWSNNQLRVKSAVRPYACKVAGRVRTMEFKKGRFVLEFTDCLSMSSLETIIVVPFILNFEILISDGAYCIQNNHVVYTHTPGLASAMHRIVLLLITEQ